MPYHTMYVNNEDLTLLFTTIHTREYLGWGAFR